MIYKRCLFLVNLLLGISLSAQQIERLEPPHWWAGMHNPSLELMIYGEDIARFTPTIRDAAILLTEVKRTENEQYLFLQLDLSKATAGSFTIDFSQGEGAPVQSIDYKLKSRTPGARYLAGFDSSDVIYLITPDRFANGDETNDVVPGLLEQSIDRANDYARHGGDIQGIIEHLDYIERMGFTALWSSPLLINDMPSYSYHGYAITDLYRVDPRFGSLEDYITLSKKAREKGLKLIMDQVINHIGVEHWWMEDLPAADWINYQQGYERQESTRYSNHRRTVNQDQYASQKDTEGMRDGWFTEAMPDLNQRNPLLATYLIQNSIWWIETLGLAGIRQDTYPYPDKAFMAEWAGAIMEAYPNFSIVGEEWSYNPLLVAYWQAGAHNPDGYQSNLRSSMDFPMQQAVVSGIREAESWDKGLIKLYEGLANDFHYPRPNDLMVFPDNHDMSRIYTQLNENIKATQMALAYLLVLPRIPQLYYGTEVLMDDSAKPGDHGLIRTDFPGGWKGDARNAFTTEGLSQEQLDMQRFLQKLLQYRKNSKAIHSGKTVHFAPEKGVYVLFRIQGAETVVCILHKNKEPFSLDLARFKEIGLDGKSLRNLLTDEVLSWQDSLQLGTGGLLLLTTKD